MKKLLNLLSGIGIVAISTFSCVFAYTQEEQEAYQWAYNYGITTQPTIEAANLEWNITRQAFAKMVINYLENAVWKKQTVSNSCNFPDENNITEDLRPYTKKTCSNNIMWSNGSDFKPMNFLSKAQLWTVLSRIIWGNEYNNNWKWYYVYHLNMLRENGIMNNIDNPDEYVKRSDVMVMFKRMYENSGSNINNDNKDLNWEYILYYDNGQIATKMNYKNGKLDWEQLVYYEDGQLKKKESYKNGELDGKQFDYAYKNNSEGWWRILVGGNNFWDEIYNYKDWKLDWEQIIYYEDGKIASKHLANNWKFNWEWTTYYENWQVNESGNYKNWELNWEQIAYYDNWQLKRKVNYKNWKLDWKQIAYYMDGQIKQKINYKDWILEWIQTWYDTDGSIWVIYNCISGTQTITYYNRSWTIIWTWKFIGSDFPYGYSTSYESGTYIISYYGDDRFTQVGSWKIAKDGYVFYLDNYKWEIDRDWRIASDFFNEWNLKIWIWYYETGRIECVYNEKDLNEYWCNIFDEKNKYKFIGNGIYGIYNDSSVPFMIPDSAEISISNEIIAWKPTDFKITILKNGEIMGINNWLVYDGIVLYYITDEDWVSLNENEFELSFNVYNNWFLLSDLWTKNIWWLTINKEWKFYIEAFDISRADKVLWKQLFTVIKS